MSIFGRHIPTELLYAFGVILGVLVLCTVAFGIWRSLKQSVLAKELFTRTKSWWPIAIGVGLIVGSHPLLGTLIICYISFVALREMLSIGLFRESDRAALFVAYFFIPIQYFLAYKGYLIAFLSFIPLIAFIFLPFILVLRGSTEKIGRSMSLIPSILILTVYMLSHIVFIYRLPVVDHPAGAGGLILFLIMITAFNDVFQFTWGKLLGRHKILPSVSPNKTWEGFVGGVLTTAGFAYVLRFLTPFNEVQSLLTGLCLGIFGFIGDSVISAIKRDLQLKDTGDLIPGHGGAMDRLDSIIFTAPLFFHLLNYFTGTL